MRTVLSDLFARFRSAGIGDAKKKARYSDDIQLVSVVDNFSLGLPTIPFSYDNLIPSTVPPLYELGISGGGAQRSTWELVPGGRGLWLYRVNYQSATQFNYAFWTIPAPRLVAPTVINPTQANSAAYGSGADSLAIVNVGAITEDRPANVQRRVAVSAANGGLGYHQMPQPWFCAVGTIVTLQILGSNTDRELGFTWRDVPPV